jgi:bifunctional non-homologous end joining protein LigD
MKPIRPMLATLVPKPFDREGWVHEEKYDGYRAGAYREGGKVRMFSRSLKDVTSEFSSVRDALAKLPGGDFILDGEVVAFDSRNVSRFQLLQRREIDKRVHPVYAVFDCLERNGERLIERPLAERRKELEAIVPAKGRDSIIRSRRLSASGLRAFETAKRKGWEGIISKDESSRYQPGKRSKSWLKVKCRKESEFVIGGYTAPEGSRSHFGALLVGLYDGRDLRYCGKVGTGYSEETLGALARKMRRLETSRRPFSEDPRERAVTWVQPKLVAQIVFAEWTRDDRLRQPAYLGLRDDKDPKQCRWEEREK